MRAETRLVAFVCAAEILGLAGFSLVPALLPQFIATWSLSNAEAGWLAGMMSGGYMAGVLPLVALTDRMPALRALTDGMTGATRARAAAWYTSSFTLGSSLSFLLGQAGLLWDWHSAFLVSGALG